MGACFREDRRSDVTSSFKKSRCTALQRNRTCFPTLQLTSARSAWWMEVHNTAGDFVMGSIHTHTETHKKTPMSPFSPFRILLHIYLNALTVKGGWNRLATLPEEKPKKTKQNTNPTKTPPQTKQSNNTRRFFILIVLSTSNRKHLAEGCLYALRHLQQQKTEGKCISAGLPLGLSDSNNYINWSSSTDMGNSGDSLMPSSSVPSASQSRSFTFPSVMRRC